MTRKTAEAAALAAVLILSVLAAASSFQGAGTAWATDRNDEEKEKDRHENKKHKERGLLERAAVVPAAAAAFSDDDDEDEDDDNKQQLAASATFALRGKGLAVWRSDGGAKSADAVLSLTGDAIAKGRGEGKVFAEGTLTVGADEYSVRAEGKAKMLGNDMGIFRVSGKALKGGEERKLQLGGILVPASNDGKQWKFVADPAAKLGRNVRIFALSGDLSVNATLPQQPPAAGGGNNNNSSAPSLDRFKVSAIGGQTAGQQFAFIVTALDASGNILKNYNGTVTLSTNNGASPKGNASSILPAMYTFVAADEGQHVFTARMYNAKADTTVTVSGSGKTATSNTFAVAPAAAAAVEVSPASSSVNSGSPVTLTATARDAYGNQVTAAVAAYLWVLANPAAGSLAVAASGTSATFTGSAAGGSSVVNVTVTYGGSSASGSATVSVNQA